MLAKNHRTVFGIEWERVTAIAIAKLERSITRRDKYWQEAKNLSKNEAKFKKKITIW